MLRYRVFCCGFLVFGSIAVSPGVEQASFWYSKVVEATVPAGANLPRPMFQPNGDFVVVSPDDPGRTCLTLFTAAGQVKRTVHMQGRPGASVVDRMGKIHLALQTEVNGKGVLHLARFSGEGELEAERDSPVGESPLPAGLMITRAGDLFVAGVGNSGLGFVGLADSQSALKWSSVRGRIATDRWQPVSMLAFQSGNVLIGGNSRLAEGTTGVRLVKFSLEGKELMTLDLPGSEATLVDCALDAEGNVIVLERLAAGGLVLLSLEGDRGLVRWKEEKLASPAIEPVALMTDPRKFILVLLNNTEEGKTRSYVVRYSLGGEALANFRPVDEENRGRAMAMDEHGEIYLLADRGKEYGEALLLRSANHLLNRYLIRYRYTTPFTAQSLAIRDQDGAGIILGSSAHDAAPGKPVVLTFRQAPVAKHETYTLESGRAFEGPSSVLGNDQYVAGAEMRLTQNPKSGQLDFRRDGTFKYTPNSGFKGKDTFRYQLSRGSLFWYAAIVTLEVK